MAATVESVVSVVLELTLVIVLLYPPVPPVPTTITAFISKIIIIKLWETCFHNMTLMRTFRPKEEVKVLKKCNYELTYLYYAVTEEMLTKSTKAINV